MAYVKGTWVSGEVISADKLNNIENGIATADANATTGSNGVIVSGAMQLDADGKPTSLILTKDDATTITVAITTATAKSAKSTK